MKKQFIILLLSMIAFSGMSQPCQAYFTTNQDTLSLQMSDASYNTDSTMINVVSWTWTLTGMGLSYTYSVQNPTEAIGNLPSGSYILCLQITTASSCSSTWCDSLYIGTPPPPICNALFGVSNFGNTFNFQDYSTVPVGHNIISWDWSFAGGTPSSSTLQHPIVTYTPSSIPYSVELTITSDLGCTSTYQASIYYNDSITSPCIDWVDVSIYPVTTIGGNDGAVDLTVYGSTPPYSFLWSNGASTEDIYNASSGIYTANIWSSDTTCPAYTITAYIPEPYDSGSVYVDTLNVPAIDSCLTFVPDSFFISGITTSGNTVSVTWVFTGGGQSATILVDYSFNTYGAQVVVITINCNSFRSQSTFMSYIYIHEAVGIEENQQLTVYPNPAENSIIIPESQSILKLSIIAIDGSIVKEIAHPEGSLNISDLPAGMYFINGETETGTVCTRFSVLR